METSTACFAQVRAGYSSRAASSTTKHVFWLLLLVVCLTLVGVEAQAQDFGYGHGTALIVLRTPKALYAAVDSKETSRVYRDGVPTDGESLMCKIRRVGPYYSFVSGVARGTNGFDALQEVASLYTPGDDLEKLAAATRESVPRMLTPLLKMMLDADPANFAKTYVGSAALQLALVGKEQNAPKVVVVEFQAAATAQGTVTLTSRTMSCPGDCTFPATGYFLGAHDAMEQSARQNPAILAKPNEDGIEKLIGLEYNSRPDIVGGPISMLKVGPSGPTVLRSGVCALN